MMSSRPAATLDPRGCHPSRAHFDRVKDGFLTKDDFVSLYDIGAEVLHSPNPYNAAGFTFDFKYAVDVWSSRIKALLTWHFVQLLGVDGLWVVRVANQGPVDAWPVMAD